MSKDPMPSGGQGGWSDLTDQMMRQFEAAISSGVGLMQSGSGQPVDITAQASEIFKLQQQYFDQFTNIWGLGTPSQDQASETKAKATAHPDLLKTSYLAWAGLVRDLVDAAPVDDKAKMQLRFHARQYIDAMSPSNFLATNPDALGLAIETRGQSLADGLKNLMADIQKGHLTITDETAFEVGGNLAVTPGAVVFENEIFQLIQYAPQTPLVGKTPLLVVPPCINKFYVLDLQPANSFVRYAVEQGQTVFLISWRSTDASTDHLTWNDYLEQGILTALDVATSITKSETSHALGFCVGGTLLGCAAAVLAGRGEQKFASLTLLTTMLDFLDPGEMVVLIDEPYVQMRESAIGQGGILDGRELALVFATLRASDLIWANVVKNYLKGATPDAFDLLYWNGDGVNLPGPMYCWYIRNAYLENNLRVPGRTIQCGVPVDFSKITIPVYALAAREDHIVPWQTAYLTTGLVGGDIRFVLTASGHIAGIVNPPARKKRSYWVNDKLSATADGWLAESSEIPGSWWSDWANWLQQQSVDTHAARDELGDDRNRPIEPAPGRYVKTRIG